MRDSSKSKVTTSSPYENQLEQRKKKNPKSARENTTTKSRTICKPLNIQKDMKKSAKSILEKKKAVLNVQLKTVFRLF